jgi:hydrogenase maturation protease
MPGRRDRTVPSEAARLAGTDPPGGAEHRPAPAPADVLVVGVGNDLRGDDGVGLAVIRELARAGIPGLQAVWSHQLVPELVEPIAAARMVVFVDAAEHVRGGVTVRPITASPPSVGGHHADPAAVLGLARHAGFQVPAAYLVSVPGHDFGVGTKLSRGARAAVPQAVRAVLRLVTEPCPDMIDDTPGNGTPLPETAGDGA